MEEGICQRCGFRFAAESLRKYQVNAAQASEEAVWSEAVLCPDCYHHERNVSRVRHREPPHQSVTDEGSQT